jgi:Zn-finger nucleic acid-binding protein
MSNCRQCAAPLPADSMVCPYCGAINEIDLTQVGPYTIHAPETARTCPDCHRALRTIDLHIDGTFLIEQCESCQGLFLDSNELESLLERAVPYVHEVDRHRLQKLTEETWVVESKIRYRHCPVCGQFMLRKTFGVRSGVVVDRCSGHGIWLDATELRRLLLWTKAGGMLLAKEQGS